MYGIIKYGTLQTTLQQILQQPHSERYETFREKQNLNSQSKDIKDYTQQAHPTGLATARFYRTAKIHKLNNDRAVDELPIRPIISNINTVSYQLAKYLAKPLSPLSTSEYTVKSTSDFITHIKGQNKPKILNLIN